MYDFLLTLRQESAHGGPFHYRSCETDVLGWVCEAAAGVRMPELMSQLLWSRLGAAERRGHRGRLALGAGMFDGGINACLRDLVRFGSLFLHGGVSLTGRAGGAAGVDRRHVRRRRRLAGGVRRQPRRQPDARRDVPQPVLVPVSRRQRVGVPGDSRPDDLRQPGGRTWWRQNCRAGRCPRTPPSCSRRSPPSTRSPPTCRNEEQAQRRATASRPVRRRDRTACRRRCPRAHASAGRPAGRASPTARRRSITRPGPRCCAVRSTG